MKRMLLLTVLSCSIAFRQTFQIEGTSIMDPLGKKFIVKGTNVTGKGSKASVTPVFTKPPSMAV